MDGNLGYAHPKYAGAFAELGKPVFLNRCQGWIIQRPIRDSHYLDASGCYPIFTCRDWSGLSQDVLDLPAEVASLSLVTDPFGEFDVEALRETFPDVMIHFKDHFVTDLQTPPETYLSSHHRQNVRRAQRTVTVDRTLQPIELLEPWLELYANLKRHHKIRGFAAFSRASFVEQLSVPGIEAYIARRRNKIVGMLLCYVQGDRAYYHLAAYSDAGYESLASFALFYESISQFTDRGLRWATLGAAPGIADRPNGLTRFKRGWSTGTRPVYFCGRVCQPQAYGELCSQTALASPTNYFPAYRSLE